MRIPEKVDTRGTKRQNRTDILTKQLGGLLLLRQNKNKQQEWYVQIDTGPVKGLLLMLRFCPCSWADHDLLALFRKDSANNQLIVEHLWGSVIQRDFDFAPLLTGYRSVCLTSVAGSEEVFSGVEVGGLFCGSSLNGLSLAGEKRNSSGTSSSAWAFL